ncbi:MAG: murein hydrolase activator EnvC family protein [Lachnospiraceae bacterium]
MKNIWKTVSVLLCTVLLISAPAQVCATEKTAADYKEEIREKKEQAEEHKQEMRASESKVDMMEEAVVGLNSEKKELQVAKNELSATVEALDAQLTNVQEVLVELGEDIDRKTKQVENIKNRLREAEANQDEQYASMKQRIKFMYEKGDTAYITMVFGAQNLTDMLNKAEYIEEVSAYDRQLLNEYTETKYRVINLKDKLEVEQASLLETQEQAEIQEYQMSMLIDQKNGEIEKYESEINTKEGAIKEYEAMIASQNATIAALEASILQAEREADALQKELEESGLSDNDIDSSSSSKPVTTQQVFSGPFCMPAPSYTRVSDDYGNRIHPILGVKQFHNGIDFAAPGGSPILAAQSGTVIAAAYSSTMGNYIMINHGGGVITIYMHASALYVSAGQTVTKGQKIAAVGTTGRSTGNHLHFSVRVNGSYVSPWSYL